MNSGCMIVCDGSNGAGKSTVIKSINDYLLSVGREVVLSREPGGTPIGEKVREIILSPDTPEMCDTTELLLFAASRAQHVQEKILPSIESGKIVLSDRFESATVSFQHYARGLPLPLIDQLNEIALNGFRADMTIILDLDPRVGLERVNMRGDGLDRLEMEKLEFLDKARNGYLEQASKYPERFAIVDASQPLAAVIEDVLSIVKEVIQI
ncbi:dTMP kinase [Vibrio sp. JC009]|uniref:dTMP kinase n=1 Tax=Vibrio sp. JC009 TaxID=2912314 RepID=UPI0023AF644C|nr:dTMP kinase [Vibrio sp. JC009]WED22679.1 dTMP kinase [Vibrio sp. JC009]